MALSSLQATFAFSIARHKLADSAITEAFAHTRLAQSHRGKWNPRRHVELRQDKQAMAYRLADDTAAKSGTTSRTTAAKS